MELNSRKEQFSVAYITALAAVAGIGIARPEPDCDSEDLILSCRLTESRILVKSDSEFSFQLSLKNYEDLRPVNLAIPRLLVVVEVPGGDDPSSWLVQAHDRLCLLHCAYWLSLYGYRAVANQATVNVRIPLLQRLTATSLFAIIHKVSIGERP